MSPVYDLKPKCIAAEFCFKRVNTHSIRYNTNLIFIRGDAYYSCTKGRITKSLSFIKTSI